MTEPSPADLNGGSNQGPDGKFLPGNRAGKGNPANRKAQALRAALMRAVAVGDLRAVVRQLVNQAKGGDVQAARLLLDRCLGPCVAIDFEDRLAALESQLGKNDHDN